MVVVADLVARMRIEGVQETAAQVKAVGESAQQTARALEIMAQAASKANPNQGSAPQILELFQRANVQPTAAALAQARTEMEKMATSAAQAVQPTQAVARAARDHAAAAATGARSAQNVADGWKMSESSLIRFGAGLAGVGLGFSLAAGAAQLIHAAVTATAGGLLDWERSLRTLSGLYGQTGAQAAAFATAQANLPGVLGKQEEFAQAAINASGLRLRYGIDQRVIDQLTTTGGRIAFTTGMTDPAQRAQLQSQILSAVTTGANLPPQYGIYTDPEAVARRLGTPGAAALQAFTPQELMQARAAIVNEGGAGFVDRAQANQRVALDSITAGEKALEQATTGLQNYLEDTGSRTDLALSPTADLEYQQSVGNAQLQARRAALGLPEVALAQVPATPASANIQGLGAMDAERRAIAATERLAKAYADSAQAQQTARETMDRLSKSVDAAAAKVLSFGGTLEDSLSIAHGDILAQAQGALTERSRSAIPTFGMGAVEIGAIARGTTSAQLWQNYVAGRAQAETTDAVRRNLQQLASIEGPGLEGARSAAQRALDAAPQLDIVNRGLGTAQTKAAQVDMATADTQARLDAISLTQRERQLQLFRDTVDLRRLDIDQRSVGIDAGMGVIRAQQAALPAQNAFSALSYEQQRTALQAQVIQARQLRGQDVSDLPTMDDLIRKSVGLALDQPEIALRALDKGRAVDVAQVPATAAGLAQQLTQGQINMAEIGVDLKNLGDLPAQLALEVELLQNNRDHLAVAREQRDLTKQLVQIMGGLPGSSGVGRVVQQMISEGLATTSTAMSPASSGLAGARR